MPSVTLVPVDHEPDFGSVSLVPVDHNPFSADGMIEQARARLASQPERLPTSYGNPDADAAALQPETFANPYVRGLIDNAATLPKRAIDASAADLTTMGSRQPMQSIGPAVETAMMTMGGGVAGAPVAAGEKVLGSGAVRKLPTDNYLGPISKHTDTLYREMHPSEALESLPGSVTYGGGGPGGVARKFYADHPDLALGQGNNRGVRVQYDAGPFEGTINKQKPAWDLSFQNGMAEYIAAPQPGVNIRDAVRSFEVDPAALSKVESAQYQRVLTNLKDKGWSVDRSNGKIVATSPSAPAAPRPPAVMPHVQPGAYTAGLGMR
jgi:hypothetical protein